MKALHYKNNPEKLKMMLEEYLMIGYRAEILDDELVVYYGKQPRKRKQTKAQLQQERWSKRERNFGYARER